MRYAFFQNNGIGEVFYAYTMSDWLGKSICVLLGCVSVWIWYAVIDKGLTLRLALKNSRAFLQDFLNAENIFELRKKARQTVSPAGEVYLAAIRRFKSFDAILPDNTCRPLTETRAPSQASLATVLRLISRDTFKYLSKRILVLLAVPNNKMAAGSRPAVILSYGTLTWQWLP